jgi:uncharacterized DUF497 family protein
VKDPFSLNFADLVEPANLITLAMSQAGRILWVISTLRAGRFRLISAREATAKERRRYEEAR